MSGLFGVATPAGTYLCKKQVLDPQLPEQTRDREQPFYQSGGASPIFEDRDITASGVDMDLG